MRRNNKRKTLCLLLSLIIAASCCTFVSANAAPADAEDGESDVYLLGDVDIDGDVTVVDATLIQRFDVNIVNEQFG